MNDETKDSRPQLIVFPRGQLTPKDRERLTKLGFCALEADDPQSVRLIAPELIGFPVAASDLFNFALQAIDKHDAGYGGTVQNTFVKLMAKHLREKNEPRSAK